MIKSKLTAIARWMCERLRSPTEEELYHRHLVAETVNLLDLVKSDDSSIVDWYAGTIPHDWPTRIDVKIAELEAESKSD